MHHMDDAMRQYLPNSLLAVICPGVGKRTFLLANLSIKTLFLAAY